MTNRLRQYIAKLEEQLEYTMSPGEAETVEDIIVTLDEIADDIEYHEAQRQDQIDGLLEYVSEHPDK